MCQIHLEGLVVPDPWIVIASPSAVATRAAAMDARKTVVAWVAFIIVLMNVYVQYYDMNEQTAGFQLGT